jgi:hypothetical protein
LDRADGHHRLGRLRGWWWQWTGRWALGPGKIKVQGLNPAERDGWLLLIHAAQG